MFYHFVNVFPCLLRIGMIVQCSVHIIFFLSQLVEMELSIIYLNFNAGGGSAKKVLYILTKNPKLSQITLPLRLQKRPLYGYVHQVNYVITINATPHLK